MQAHPVVRVQAAHTEVEPPAAPNRPAATPAAHDRPDVMPGGFNDPLARMLRASVQRRPASESAVVAVAAPTLQRCKKKKPQKMSLGEFYAQTPAPKPVSAWSAPLPAAGLVGISVPSSAVGVVAAPDVSAYTSALEGWSPGAGHGGKRGTTLSTAEARAIVAYVESGYSRSGKVFVGKGAGSGEWADKVQLKVIHKTATVGGGKKATYHITLKDSVYAALSEVPELGD